MNTGVIDRFTEVFTRYIDSGFGLLGGEVAFLASTLIALDVTIAGLFWAWGADEDVLAHLIKKTLYVGFFAFLIGNFNGLAKIVFNSFTGLGPEGRRFGSHGRPVSPAWPARTGRHRCRQADTAGREWASGLRLVLSELRPDIRAACRLAYRPGCVLHPGDPALCHADRVQAHHACRFRPGAVRAVRPDGVSGRTGSRQR